MTTQILVKAVDEELKQSLEIIYLPDTPDAHGQYASATTLRKACASFNENLEKGHVVPNLYHGKDDDGEVIQSSAFTIEKSWINEVECVVGETVVPEGTWLCKLQWNNDQDWELRKSGVYAGVSFGGRGCVTETATT